MQKMFLTTHTLVKNEDQFVWFALNSVLPYVDEMIVFNDDSIDRTEERIKLIKSPKIKYEKVSSQKLGGQTALRNEMIKRTKSPWFMLLDGDEIWNTQTISDLIRFLREQPEDINAVAMRTRNVVGDFFHYLPEDAGRYELLGRKGHLTTRVFRNRSGFHWEKEYPLEFMADSKGESITKKSVGMTFFDHYYWHATHLRRSSNSTKVPGFRKQKVELGIEIKNHKILPEIFWQPRPSEVPSPLFHRSFVFDMKAVFITPVKLIRRKLFQT